MKNRLKEIRIKQNLTQEELSKKADVSRYLISKIENGKDVNITKNTMINLSKALNSKVSDIFFILSDNYKGQI